ncbi:MAG: TonB-dependent receptor, partial [Bacteroidaceae bacterium]|nr:TonB-dependent receptor [Bacteroidaceae bacterium]
TAEGGWAYRHYNPADKSLAPVAYNDECSYKRFNISEGLVIKRAFDWGAISSTTGYQYVDDRMRLDNDFLPLDYFSMGQYQKEHSLTQEFVVKADDLGAFNILGGLFGFFKHNNMSAPVHFKQYGIDNLILKNANEEWYNDLDNGTRELSFKEDNFVIPAFGVAAFVQGGFSLHGFDVKAGLRVDYEYSSMSYDSHSTVHYSTYKEVVGYEVMNTVFKGQKAVDALVLLPSLSVSYGGDWGNVYASARKGFKAGGFNTQLFSDILKQKMMNSFVGSDDDIDASSTVYKPETNWTIELGTHLSPLDSKKLDIMASLFYIDCRNQQLTNFPDGESTGRMMSNAGRSFSAGAELSARYVLGDITFDAGFGYTHAEFIKYNRGDVDLSGKILPYAPRETYSLNVAYRLPVPRSFANFFVLNVGWNGVGRTFWNEENTLSQPFYSLLSASLAWEKGHWGVSLWGKNLLNEKYNTFYFRSIGNDFFAQGKPLHFGISMHINL